MCVCTCHCFQMIRVFRAPVRRCVVVFCVIKYRRIVADASGFVPFDLIVSSFHRSSSFDLMALRSSNSSFDLIRVPNVFRSSSSSFDSILLADLKLFVPLDGCRFVIV
eukprot:512498_1